MWCGIENGHIAMHVPHVNPLGVLKLLSHRMAVLYCLIKWGLHLHVLGGYEEVTQLKESCSWGL